MSFDPMDIVRAMQIISDSNTQKLRLDKTIVAQITSIENLETGEYRVAYEGNSFLAYASDVTVSYSEKENVYVKIPENDMTNRKIIEGRITGSTLSDIIEQQVEINTIEPSLDKFYGYEADETYGIVAGVDPKHRYFMRTIFDSKGSNVGDHMFQSYAANYDKIKITGSFSTKFVGTHHKGNYGLIVTFKTLRFSDNGREEQGTISYRLDFSSFVGDPYRYTSPSPQSVIIDIFKDTVIGLDSIILFQENFETDKSVNYDNQIIYENRGEDNPSICNIFVKDIDISFCEVIDLKETSYYLTIASPQGIVFSGNTTTLTLNARLKHKGANILSKNSCRVYWYKEDLTVKKGDERYDKLAGVRWAKIESSTPDYTPSITVNSRDVKIHARYKAVVIYQDDITLSKEIEVKQLNGEHDLRISQTTKNNSRIVLQVVSNIEDDDRDYVAEWYFFLPDGSYGLIDDGEKKSEIDVTDYLIYPTATFYCQTYCEDEPISIEVHNFAISDSQDDLTITYLGSDIYQYDANGDIAYEATETDRTLGIKVEWKEGFGADYTITYLAPDGVELSKDYLKAHTPENSMMEKLWVDNTSILHYNIRQKYNLNYNNNIITVKIRCRMNGQEYSFRKEILFLKDGDQGTNGTTYICAIRPVDLKTGDKLNGFHALQYNNGWIGTGLDLRCYVYKNGDLLNDNQNFELTFNWECGSKDGKIDKLSINPIVGFTDLNDYRRIQGIGSLDTKGDYVVKMTLTIREKNNSERAQIHCQYPVDIAVGGFDTDALNMNLPSYVRYTASGINASFLNQKLECKYNGDDIPIYSTDTSILQITNNKLDPAQKFQYSGGIAALRCEVSETMYLLHPIMMYLDTYGNEAINGWDGTKLELNEDGGYILAPQIGAGEKHADNTFTGVVMGKDTAQDKVGLYGYDHGIAQFGFKEDGTAFIGASGSGQILFDGNKGTITSGNYTSTTGMKIDLDDGHIDSYNFKISSGNMILDSANQKFDFTIGSASGSRFQITHKNGNRLLYITDGTYYLQSQDYVSNTSGTKIDLGTGRIDSYNFKLYTSSIDLDSANNRFTFKVDSSKTGSYFRIMTTDGTTLFNAASGTNNYYLQSANYVAGTSNNSDGPGAGTGMKITLNTGTIDAYTFNLRSSCLTINSQYSRFTFDVSANGANGSFTIKGRDENGNSKIMLYASLNSYYLQSANYNGYTGNSMEGVYLNLQTGVLRVGGNADIRGTIRASALYIGGSTTNVVSGTGLTGNALADGAVSSVKIANGAITATKISDGAVSSTKIAGGAITTEKIAANAITTSKIQTGAVTANQIAANTITSAEIATGAITANKIASGAVTADKISAGAITANKIAAGAITADKLAANVITSVKVLQTDRGLYIADNAINLSSYGAISFSSGGLTIDHINGTSFNGSVSMSTLYISTNLYMNNTPLNTYVRNIVSSMLPSSSS